MSCPLLDLLWDSEALTRRPSSDCSVPVLARFPFSWIRSPHRATSRSILMIESATQRRGNDPRRPSSSQHHFTSPAATVEVCYVLIPVIPSAFVASEHRVPSASLRTSGCSRTSRFQTYGADPLENQVVFSSEAWTRKRERSRDER